MKDDKSIFVSTAVKAGIGLIALLFVLNSVFLYLFVNEKKRNKELARTVKEMTETMGQVRQANEPG